MIATVAARLTLALAGLALPVLLLELTFRVFGPIVPGNYETGVWAEGHPVVGHAHVPGATAWIREPEFTTYLRFNRYGLRGPEIAEEKPSGTQRVLLLGDSFLEAKQVAEAETTAARLADRLDGPELGSIEILNSGVFDWSQVHEHLYLQHAGPTLQPDLVVQFFYLANDIGDAGPRSRGELRELERPVAALDDDDRLVLPEWRRRTPEILESVLNAVSRRSTAVRAFETGVVDKFRYA